MKETRIKSGEQRYPILPRIRKVSFGENTELFLRAEAGRTIYLSPGNPKTDDNGRATDTIGTVMTKCLGPGRHPFLSNGAYDCCIIWGRL